MGILSKVYRKNLIQRLWILLFISLLLVFFTIGCKRLEMNSSWKDREVVVDGLYEDWANSLTYFEKKNVAIGLLNDDEFLYLCFVTEDRILARQIMGRGLILWLDPEGGKKKTFGIRFPIGMQGAGMSMMRRGGEQDQERVRDIFSGSRSELEILGPGKDESERMLASEVKGIAIYLNNLMETIVYEIKIPLIQSEEHPCAVGAENGALVGVGFEIPQIDMDAMRNRMGGETGGGMRGGGMRGGGRPGGGRPGGGRSERSRMAEMNQQLKIWAAVQLAAETRSVQE